jgi:hypothetical protein
MQEENKVLHYIIKPDTISPLCFLEEANLEL